MGNLLTPRLNAEFQAEQTEIDNLTGINEALEQLCDPNLSSEDRADWIEVLYKFENALECSIPASPAGSSPKPNDVLHQF